MKRKIAFLLAFVALLSLATASVSAKDNSNVAAGEEVIISIDNSSAYTYWFHKGHDAEVHPGFVTSDDYSLGSPRHGTDGKTLWVYCLEFQVDGNTAAIRTAATPSSSKNDIWTGLSEEQQLGITLATLYGYPVSKNGGDSDDAFAATQCIIWEFQTGVRKSTKEDKRQSVKYKFTDGGVTETMTLDADYFYDIMATKKSGKETYETLIEKIYNHFKEPSFASSKIELTYDAETGKYTKKLTDKNGVLSSYDVTCDDDIKASMSGNTLTLTASKYVNGAKLTLTKKDVTTTSQKLMILDPEMGQTMLTGQANVPVKYTYKVYALNGSLKVKKKSADGIISGVKFKVSGNGINEELVTDSSGVATLSNIPTGTYTVTEVMSDRYVKISPKTITVEAGQTAVASFSNVLKSGSLKVMKVDSKTGKGVPGAQFEVYDKDDNHIATETSGADGIATFKGLEYGSYYVFESLAPAGYLLSEEKYSFNIKTDGQVVTWECTDENLMRQFSVYKKGEVLTGFEKDGDCFKPVYEEQYLADAQVGIFAGEDIYTVDGTRRNEKDELIETLVTDASGPVYTSELFEGVYYAKELSAPSGYVLGPASPVEVCLFSDDLSVGFSNDRQKCSLNFVKLFDDDSKDFSAVTFGLYNSSSILDLPADSLLEVIRPDADGNCTMTCDLPCGYDYYIKELSTAPGYGMLDLTYAFSFMPMSDDMAVHLVTLDPITNHKFIVSDDDKGPDDEPEEETPSDEPEDEPDDEEIVDTADINGEELRFYIITAVEALALLVVVIVRKNKLTLYY